MDSGKDGAQRISGNAITTFTLYHFSLSSTQEVTIITFDASASDMHISAHAHLSCYK